MLVAGLEEPGQRQKQEGTWASGAGGSLWAEPVVPRSQALSGQETGAGLGSSQGHQRGWGWPAGAVGRTLKKGHVWG